MTTNHGLHAKSVGSLTRDRSLPSKRRSPYNRLSFRITGKQDNELEGVLVSVDQWSQFLSKELEIEITGKRLDVQAMRSSIDRRILRPCDELDMRI
jgi:hypothetical protein